MKKTTGAILFIVILVVFGLGTNYIVTHPKLHQSNVIKDNIFVNETDNNIQIPIGTIGFESETIVTDNSENYFVNYYYQGFGEEKKLLYKVEDIPGVFTNVVGTKKPFIEKINNEYIVKLWDQKNNDIEELYTIMGKQFNFRFQGVFLSPDSKYVYVATAYNATDWNNNQFSNNDLGITTEIIQINVSNKQVINLFKYVGGSEYYSINNVTESQLILIKSIAESDWQQYVIFDIENKVISKEFEEGWMVTALSPNGKYFAFNNYLYSKGGNYNPSSMQIMNMEKSENIPTNFLTNYEFGSDLISENNIWTNYIGLTWGSDNKSLFVLKEVINENALNSYTVFKIDLAEENIIELFNVPEDLTDVGIFGIYQDNIFLRDYGFDGESIWKFPEQVKLYSSEVNSLSDLDFITTEID